VVGKVEVAVEVGVEVEVAVKVDVEVVVRDEPQAVAHQLNNL